VIEFGPVALELARVMHEIVHRPLEAGLMAMKRPLRLLGPLGEIGVSTGYAVPGIAIAKRERTDV
jgi:hypothetical protein